MANHRKSRRPANKHPRPEKSEELYQEPLPFDYRLANTVISLPFSQQIRLEDATKAFPGSEPPRSKSFQSVKWRLEEARGTLLIFASKAILVGALAVSDLQLWAPRLEQVSQFGGGPPPDAEAPLHPLPGLPPALHAECINFVLDLDVGFSIDMAKFHAYNYEASTYNPKTFMGCWVKLGDNLVLILFEKGRANLHRVTHESDLQPVVSLIATLPNYRTLPRLRDADAVDAEAQRLECITLGGDDNLGLDIEKLEITDYFRSANPNLIAARQEELQYWLEVVGRRPEKRPHRDRSPKRRSKHKSPPLESTIRLAEIAFEVWGDCDAVCKAAGAKCETKAVSVEEIKKCLLRKKSFRYQWLFDDSNEAQYVCRITIPRIDTGVRLTWHRKTKDGVVQSTNAMIVSPVMRHHIEDKVRLRKELPYT